MKRANGVREYEDKDIGNLSLVTTLKTVGFNMIISIGY